MIYLREQKNRSSIELLIPYDQIELLPEEDAYFIELLLRNIIGFTAQKVHFDEEILSEKLESPLHLNKYYQIIESNLKLDDNYINIAYFGKDYYSKRHFESL